MELADLDPRGRWSQRGIKSGEITQKLSNARAHGTQSPYKKQAAAPAAPHEPTGGIEENGALDVSHESPPRCEMRQIGVRGYCIWAIGKGAAQVAEPEALAIDRFHKYGVPSASTRSSFEEQLFFTEKLRR